MNISLSVSVKFQRTKYTVASWVWNSFWKSWYLQQCDKTYSKYCCKYMYWILCVELL